MMRKGDELHLGMLLSCLCLLAIGSKTIEWSDPPKTVVKKYFVAVYDGDLAAVRQNAAGDAANQFAAELVVRAAATMKVVNKAAAEKFGPVVIGPNNLPFNLVMFDSTQLDQATEKITGESATVSITIPGAPAAMPIQLKREAGKWKVDVDSAARMPVGNPKFIDGMRKICDEEDAEATRIAADITAGKYATALEAYAAAKARFDAVAAKKIKEIADSLPKAK